MGQRAYWSSDLAVGTLVVPVQAFKATGVADPEDTSPLKRLCACHNKPFKFLGYECPGGGHPWSQAAEDRGDEDLVEVVHGVPADGSDEWDEDTEWTVLDEEVFDDIRQTAKLEDLEVDPGDVVRLDEVPIHLLEGAWYLAPKVEKGKKGAKRLRTFTLLVRALEQRQLALMAIWTPRINSHPKLVTIFPRGDALMMCEMPFRAEVRIPEDNVIGHGELEVSEKEVDMVAQYLAAMCGEFKYSSYKDVTVGLRRKAIEEALAGRPVTPRVRPEVEEVEDDDLMATLERSLALVKSGEMPRRKADLDEQFGADAPWTADDLKAVA